MHFCRSHRARRFGRAANLEVGLVTGVHVSVGLGDRLQRPRPLRIGECPTCPLVEACIRGQTDQRSQSRMGGWKKYTVSLWMFTICQPYDLGDTFLGDPRSRRSIIAEGIISCPRCAERDFRVFRSDGVPVTV